MTGLDMTQALSPQDRNFLDAVRQADIMAAAGRMIANPMRARISQAEQFAMSLALERSQGAIIESRLLLAALALPETGDQHDEAVKDHAIQTQMHRLRAELVALDGQPIDGQAPDKQAIAEQESKNADH